MKLLTFLGVARYESTTYRWQDQECTANFAPVASCRFFKPEELIVFLSKDAEEKVFPDFKAALPPGLTILPVQVPLGANQAELWEIFSKVSSSVNSDDRVVFDITLGLRSYPLIGLLAAAFLRVGLNITLEAVVYGAYDVGKSLSPGYTPLFDLSPMLSLLEWASAADRFNRTGDSRYLAALLNNQRKILALSAQGNPAKLREAGHLGNLAGTLTSITQSLRLIRPHQAMEQVAGLPERVDRARPSLEYAATALPFSLLLENVVQTYLPLARSGPLNPDNLDKTLTVEREMIHWYADREQWVQCISLAREWLVSWIMVQLGLKNITQLSARHRIEGVVSAEAKDNLDTKQAGKPFKTVFLAEVPAIDAVLELWTNLTRVRNDIDHAGMREEPGKPEELIRNINNCVEMIDAIPVQISLTDS